MPHPVGRLNRATLRWSPRQLARRALVGCAPRSRLLENLPGEKAVYLTFDDGPHPEQTPRVLDVLAKCRVSATFFVVGQACERHPELVRRIVDEGHSIGHHSYSHLDAQLTRPREYLQDVRRGGIVLRQIVPEAPRLFRPPYGRLGLATLLPLLWSGETVVLWNVDVRDYATELAEIQQWLKHCRLYDGDIILMHDSQPHAAVFLPELIAKAESSGFVCRSLRRPESGSYPRN